MCTKETIPQNPSSEVQRALSVRESDREDPLTAAIMVPVREALTEVRGKLAIRARAYEAGLQV